MYLGIADRTALVLAAGGGLGSAIATVLAAEGATVVVADRNENAASATAKGIVSSGGRAHALAWDLGDLSAIEANVTSIEQQLGHVDILVNITGSPPPTTAAGQPASLWTEYFQTLVLPVIALTDRVLPAMRDNQWGRIITSTSSGIIAPIRHLGLSNSLRLTLAGWSKTLAAEVGGEGITANVVVPGRIGSARVDSLDAKRAEREHRSLADVQAESRAAIPTGRYGDPVEYANAVAFLASTAASYINGSIVRVDGGLIASI